MRNDASAAASDAGTFDAVKMNGSDVIVSNSIASALPITAPPHEPRVFEKVTVTMSTRSSTS
jgi:hypothetical protein